jgi:CDP-diacylglycerol---serine O-phosphatidyltransferase
MLKPVKAVPVTSSEVPVKRKRPLRTISMLPTLLTLGNLCLGFGAIYLCGRELEELGLQRTAQEILTWNSPFLENLAPSYLSIAVWMIAAAMVCDALDGRVARKTGQASKFGEQMDSLADVVSSGVAPALIMMTMVRRELIQWSDYAPFGFERFGQLTVLIGIVYVSCAALRLARFNVEASMAQASHEGFRGLPSPGAAGAVVSLVIVHDHLDQVEGWVRTADFITHMLPFATLALGLLMVSRVPYRHAVSVLLRRRPFEHLIAVLLLVPLLLLYTKQVLMVAAWSFVLSGIIRMVWAKLSGQQPQISAEPADQEQLTDSSSSKKQIL